MRILNRAKSRYSNTATRFPCGMLYNLQHVRWLHPPSLAGCAHGCVRALAGAPAYGLHALVLRLFHAQNTPKRPQKKMADSGQKRNFFKFNEI